MNGFEGYAAGCGRRGSTLAAALLALALLAGCATTAGQRSVEQRAQARWDALLAGDFDSAYALYSPGYRSATSRVDYEVGLRLRRVWWTAAAIEGSACDGAACTVAARVRYRVGSPVPGVPKWESERRLEERWVRTGGQWWYVPEE